MKTLTIPVSTQPSSGTMTAIRPMAPGAMGQVRIADPGTLLQGAKATLGKDVAQGLSAEGQMMASFADQLRMLVDG